MLAALAEDRLLLVAEGAALLALQLGDGLVGLALPLIAEAFVEHQRQDVVLVVLPRGLAAEDVRRAPEMGLELLERELHPGRRSALKYRRCGSCGPVPISRTSPRPTKRASRVRVARGVRPIAAAISLVSNPLPVARLATIAWSVSSSRGRPTRAVAIVTRKRVASSSNTGAASPASSQAAL